MRRARGDDLRGAITLFGIALLAAGLLSLTGYYFQREAAAEFNQGKARFESERRRYLALGEQAALLKAHYSEFARLYRRGVLGPEQRLNWLETLGQAGLKSGLPRLDYEIGARQAIQPDYAPAHGAYQIYKSEMRLGLGLLHEADLLRVFDYLDRNARGHYTVRKCSFRGSEGPLQMTAGAVNLTVDCELEWLTINLPDGGELRL